MKRLRATVSGRVQGVSFRYYTRRQAVRLGLTGWVRNEVDGTVTVEAEGSPDSLDNFYAFLQQGPPSAKVRDVVAEWEDGRQRFASFQIVL